jgi:hypothetical protein
MALLPFNPLKEPWPRIIGIPASALALVMFLSERPVTALDYIIMLFVAGFIWQGCYGISQLFHRLLPGTQRIPLRLVLTTVTRALYIIVLDLLIRPIPVALGLQDNFYSIMGRDVYLIVGFVSTFLIGSIYEAGYFFEQWKLKATEAEALRNRQLRAELEVLRNQISPHFLFNSLHALLTLIHEDVDQASQFTKDLSRLYRYILIHKDKDVVDLGSELDFTQAYINLLKVRFPRSQNILITVAPEHRRMLIPPLAIQILLENALKHNVAGPARPLEVTVSVEDGPSLVVSNSLNPGQGPVEGTGTGLANIRQRYAYLSDRPVRIAATQDQFVVALPLLQYAEQEQPSMARREYA